MREHTVRCGVVGQADLNGILKVFLFLEHTEDFEPVGVRLCVEIKSGKSRQSDKQKAFQVMIEDMGGIYVVARSLEGAKEDIKKIAEEKFGIGCLKFRA